MEYRGIGQNVNIPLYKYYGNIAYAKDAIEKHRIHLEMPAEYNDIYDSSYSISSAYLKFMHLGNFLRANILRKYYDFLSEDELEELIK